MGVYICTWKSMVRIIESNQIENSTKITIEAKNGFDFLDKVSKICYALNGKIIAESII